MPESARAWHPQVPLVREVLHATFHQHAYPAHTHDDWTLLLVDEGAVSYSLDRTQRLAAPETITLLPPHIPHDGRSADRDKAFHKRVIYLDEAWLPHSAVDAVAGTPTLRDPVSLAAVMSVHDALRAGDGMAAESGLTALRERVMAHLGTPATIHRDAPLARRLRDLLDDRMTESFTLAEAATILCAHPSHLVRTFSATYGIPPHRYVTGRRVDRARHLLARGVSAADAAVAVGFHDQAHMSRHFRRILGVAPGTFAAAA